MTRIVLEWPLAWMIGLPLSAALLVLFVWSQRIGGRTWRQIAVLTALRGIALATLVLLIARPVRVDSEEDLPPRDSVVLLVDRSESMSLEEGGTTRYNAAVSFARSQLLPALQAADLRVKPLLFAEEAEPATGEEITAAQPDGRQTNLARAIARGATGSQPPPLAVIALTDGAATEDADNARALTSLVENGVPFIGVGFGHETGTRVLTLQQLVAPLVVPPNQQFRISASLQVTGEGELPAFDLLLLRDGKLAQKKTAAAGSGARVWLESFTVEETTPGQHQYRVQLLPPPDPAIKTPNAESSVSVRITEEKELRVLFVQGGLTWDFKFIQLALRGDPTIKLTGLSRTASQSMFFQNVESDEELVGGFPTTIERLATFRVVVLSNLSPSDLTSPQQELLARFCREFGGGVLMIGGADTFNASWQQSRLEQLLPVRFTALSNRPAGGQPFQFQLTEEAHELPLFQISDAASNRAAWAGVPTFTHYAAVDSVKPGARVWAVHSNDSGPGGRRVLMAAQRYGAGTSAAICVQNFWRWRLAKDADTRQFDRFWQQLFRYLGEGSSETVAISFPDQQLRPNADLRVVLEQRATATTNVSAKGRQYTFRVEREGDDQPADQSVELKPAEPLEVTFRAERGGLYTLSVLDSAGAAQATRTVEVKDLAREFVSTARNMETLRQWSGVSGGLALAAEDCDDVEQLLTAIRTHAAHSRRTNPQRQPAGINGWMLGLLLACLCTDWLLRKHWGFT
jgi:uncharacterized membrane protein